MVNYIFGYDTKVDISDQRRIRDILDNIVNQVKYNYDRNIYYNHYSTNDIADDFKKTYLNIDAQNVNDHCTKDNTAYGINKKNKRMIFILEEDSDSLGR